MTNQDLLVSLLINLILVHLTSGQASAGPRCAFKEEEQASVKVSQLFSSTTWQMCLNFACLYSGVNTEAAPGVIRINNGTGIRSIGAYNYLEHRRAQGSFHLGIMEAPIYEVDYPPKGEPTSYPGAYEIEAYPLTYKNAPLFGWFHLRLKQLGNRAWFTSDKRPFNRDIQWFLTQAQMNSTNYNYERNHIFGEFLHGGFKGDCVTKGLGYDTEIKLSRQNVQPCLSAQNPSPVMSQAFAWNAEAHSPSNEGLREARFNWRLNFPLCPVFSGGAGIDNGVIFRTLVQGNMSRPLDGRYPANTYRGRMALTGVIGLKDYVSGGHDPAPPPHASPSCSEACPKNPPPWVDGCSGDKKLFWGSDPTNNPSLVGTTCTSVIDREYAQGRALKRRFYGRCDLSSNVNPVPAPDLAYFCEATSPFYEGLETHSVCVAGVKAYQEALCVNCPLITSTTTMKPPPTTVRINMTLELNKIYQAEIICHGICMTMATILTVPLGNYVARYFKESFMGWRILQIHAWYQLHAHLYCASLVLLIVGWILAWNAPGPGTATFVKLHAGFGRLSIVMFVFVFLISGIRSNRWSLLNCTVAVHTVGGYVCFVLFLSVYLLTLPMKSSLVPPTSLYSPAMFAHSVKSAWVVLGTFGFWILFTVVCNVESSFLIRSKDKSAGVEGARQWILGFIPLPAIPFDKDNDLDGTGKRVARGVVFMGVSLVATFFIIATMSKHHFQTLLQPE